MDFRSKTTIFVEVFQLRTKTSHNLAKYFIQVFIRELKIESISSSGTSGKIQSCSTPVFQLQSPFVSDPQQLYQVVNVVTPNKNLKAAYQQDLPQMI